MESNKTQFLLCLLFLLAWLNRGTGYTLSIGAILDTRSRIGKEQIVALEVAARRFNTSSQVLLLNTTEVQSTDPLQAVSSAEQLIQQGAQVIISTGTWPQILGISDVGKHQEVPIISLTSSGFLNKPFWVQMSYPDSDLVNCLAAIVKSYKWRRVITVYEDDDYGTVSGTALLLSHALQDVSVQIDYSLVFPPMDLESYYASTIIEDKLNHMKERREIISTVYVILRMSENLVKAFFQEATELGMMHNGSAWICGPDITTLLDSSLNSSFVSNYMQGVIGVRPYVNESTTEYVEFSNSFQQSFKYKYESNNETTFNPGVYAVRSYDAMHVITLAANKSERNNSLLVKSMLESNFTGLSGLVTPLGNSDLIFQVINVVGKSYKEIGFWSNSSGFYNKYSRFNLNASLSLEQLSVVLWPGEATNASPAGIRTLKISAIRNSIWGEPKRIKLNGSTIETTSISGFCIDVFRDAMTRFNREISWEFQLINRTSEFSYDDFVNKVYSEDVDIVVGDVTITSSRAEKVSFTEPFIASGIPTIVPIKRENVGWTLLKPFTPNLWMTIFFLLFYNFCVIWYLEKMTRHLTTIFEAHEIGSFYSKTVIISWLLVVLIISNCFTANLSSILVADQLKPVVDTSKIGCDNDSFVVKYLENALNFNKIIPIEDPKEYSDAFENGTITAAYIESPYVPEFLSKNKNYAVYGETQMLGGFAFVSSKMRRIIAELSKIAILRDQPHDNIEIFSEKANPRSLPQFYRRSSSSYRHSSAPPPTAPHHLLRRSFRSPPFAPLLFHPQPHLLRLFLFSAGPY
ncbi:Glutamate receptor [Rhynchospora pubera]|uniref:Glutamate receptor n=1 Tax=Rhynchospora pubera TaxID=906938 RepID=A0AAV8HYW9_9POAL|nr:Glutamate receptor [Rhynchospora pubera]